MADAHPRAPDAPQPIQLRPPAIGELGWIIRRQAQLYAQEYGWDWTYEALVAEIIGQYGRSRDDPGQAAWVAERGGRVLGSVFVVRREPQVAQLRLLYVEPEARGEGLGRRLVLTVIDFARAQGYRELRLWTNSVLLAARRVYEATGFTLLEEAPHYSFGHALVGQTWGRAL